MYGFANWPVDWADAGNVVLWADALRQEPVPDFPGEHGGVVLLVLGDGVNHVGCRHFGLGPAYHSGLEVAGLVKPENKNRHILLFLIRNHWLGVWKRLELWCNSCTLSFFFVVVMKNQCAQLLSHLTSPNVWQWQQNVRKCNNRPLLSLSFLITYSISTQTV